MISFQRGSGFPLFGQVSELPDVVAFHVGVRATGFACIREESLHNFGSIIPDRWGRVVQDDTGCSSKRDTAPGRYEWRLPVACHGDPQYLGGTSLGLVHPLEPADHLWHGKLQLGCQCLGQGSLHDPPQFAEPIPVMGQRVVFRDASELCRVLAHNTEFGV